MKSVKFIAFVLVLLAFATLSGASFAEATKEGAEAAAAADQKISFEESNWEKRCQADKDGKEDKSKCEIFKIIRVKESKGRVAEFAIGKGGEKDPAGSLSGVVVLPLGVLLEEGILMKVDDNSPVMFKPRFCAQVGCVSYISLDAEMQTQMKSGKKISFVFRSSNGQKVNIDLMLEGFEKAVKGVIK